MLKNITLFRIEGDAPESLQAMEEALQAAPFSHCAPTQTRSAGWVPPRDEGGALIESIGGHWIAKLAIETRSVPGQALKRAVDAKADEIAQQTGRTPRGKALRELKETTALELLPRAFPKLAYVPVWIDPRAKLIAVGSATSAAIDVAASHLVEAAPAMNLHMLHTVASPAGSMAAWLVSDAPPAGFTIDREAELHSGADGASVRYARHNIDADEVARHVEHGMVPKTLALTHEGRVSFLLTATLKLKRVELLGAPLEGDGSAPADAFDADVAITTGTLAPAIAALIDALGGLALPPVLAAAGNITAGTPAGESAPPPHTGEGPDPLLDQARAIVTAERRGSISLVQRHLRIGYNRAARLLEALEAAGVVSPVRADGSRTVNVEN